MFQRERTVGLKGDEARVHFRPYRGMFSTWDGLLPNRLSFIETEQRPADTISTVGFLGAAGQFCFCSSHKRRGLGAPGLLVGSWISPE